MLTDSKIYTVSGTVTSIGGYYVNFNGKEIAVVTLPGSKLITDASLTSGEILIDLLSNAYFLWVEGDFEGSAGNTNFMTSIGRHGVLRRARVSKFESGFGDGNQSSTSSWINQVVAAHNLYTGIRVKGSSNTFQDVAAVSNDADGFTIGDLSDDNIFVNVLSANNNAMGIYHYGSDRNTFIAVTSINNGSYGIYSSNDDYSDYINVVLKNNSSGYFLSGTTNSTYSQTIAESIGVISSSNLKFTGRLIVTSSTLACSTGGGTNPGLVNGTCAVQGSSNHTLIHSNGFGDTSFMGAVISDDTANGSDALGVASFSNNLDWTHFDNPFRAWGKVGTFLSAAMSGFCSTGNCQIWDYQLKPSSTHLKNTTGDGITQNTAFTDGAACPAAVDGSVFTIDRRASARTFLTNAVEIFGTGGNNNGVCESMESCMYMPNFGADQGSGDFRSKKCTFSDGTVLSVKMYGY